MQRARGHVQGHLASNPGSLAQSPCFLTLAPCSFQQRPAELVQGLSDCGKRSGEG